MYDVIRHILVENREYATGAVVGHSQKSLLCEKWMNGKYGDILGIRTRTNEKNDCFPNLS